VPVGRNIFVRQDFPESDGVDFERR